MSLEKWVASFGIAAVSYTFSPLRMYVQLLILCGPPTFFEGVENASKKYLNIL